VGPSCPAFPYLVCSREQWRQLDRAGGPHFYKWLGTVGGTVIRRTANKTPTKLYWPPRKRSLKRLIVLVAPKKWWGTTKKSSDFRAECVIPQRSYSFRWHRRHWPWMKLPMVDRCLKHLRSIIFCLKLFLQCRSLIKQRLTNAIVYISFESLG